MCVIHSSFTLFISPQKQNHPRTLFGYYGLSQFSTPCPIYLIIMMYFFFYFFGCLFLAKDAHTWLHVLSHMYDLTIKIHFHLAKPYSSHSCTNKKKGNWLGRGWNFVIDPFHTPNLIRQGAIYPFSLCITVHAHQQAREIRSQQLHSTSNSITMYVYVCMSYRVQGKLLAFSTRLLYILCQPPSHL